MHDDGEEEEIYIKQTFFQSFYTQILYAQLTIFI